MKTVLIISYSNLHRDPRIIRQIRALKDNYKIITIGMTPIADNNIKYYQIGRIKENSLGGKIKTLFGLISGDYYPWYARRLDFANIISQKIEPPDVIIANDWDGMALASELKTKKKWDVKIYFDAHEYAPKEFDSSIKWRLLRQPVIIKALKECRKDIDVMTTVSDGIAREYERFFDFPAGSIEIITNAPDYLDNLKPFERNDNKIKLIHHGGGMRIRKLELMIKMMKHLDSEKYELTFMLVYNDKKYYDYLVQLSKKYKNIYFIPPVGTSEISLVINKYDVGVYLLGQGNFNDKYALPNKLFEFIQARLAIAIGPSIEMSKIVGKYNLGVVSKKITPKSLADSSMRLTPEKIAQYKTNSDKYAKELSVENNLLKIKSIVSILAGE
jgi:hypothetical protein